MDSDAVEDSLHLPEFEAQLIKTEVEVSDVHSTRQVKCPIQIIKEEVGQIISADSSRAKTTTEQQSILESAKKDGHHLRPAECDAGNLLRVVAAGNPNINKVSGLIQDIKEEGNYFVEVQEAETTLISLQENSLLDCKREVGHHVNIDQTDNISTCSSQFRNELGNEFNLKKNVNLFNRLESSNPIESFALKARSENPTISSVQADVNDADVPYNKSSEFQSTHQVIPTHRVNNSQLCSVYQREFFRENRFQTHVNIHGFGQQLHLGNHVMIHADEKHYSCNTCKKKFKRKSGLINHMLIHTGEKPHSCDICNKEFRHRSHLKSHVLIHTGEKAYSCSICKKHFKSNQYLKSHMLIHSGEKPHTCDVCKKTFREVQNLKRHMVIHTREKSYSCDICQKNFTGKYGVHRHMLIHTGEKPFHCSICKRRFRYSRSFKRHMLHHTDKKQYSCSICRKDFRRNHTLKNHMLIHTGEKPYSCDNCHKNFSCKQGLRRHMPFHDGEKPYSRNIGKRKFTQKQN